MSTRGAEPPLSGIELVVLACLSQSKSPKDDVLGNAVRELCQPDASAEHARAAAVDTVTALRQRGLVSQRGRKPSTEGGLALRAAFGLARKPTWSAVRDRHLPALAFGLEPGSEAAARAVRNGDAIMAEALRRRLGIRDASTATAMCDTLIAEALGMPPGPITLDRIRTHMLARRAGVKAEGKSGELAMRLAAEAVGASQSDKTLAMALGRRWLRGETLPPSLCQGDMPRTSDPGDTARTTDAQRTTQSPQAAPANAGQPTNQSAQPTESLLEVVRETIPQIGADGRFGSEKVFVSALWHRIERSIRPAELSLDHFKRWLVTANRDGSLVLVRADLIGAMDAKQVAESEIRDRGATFHFVLDSQSDAPAARGGTHVR
jgi:lambda repressor-like predicted transcriptional regulator